MLPALSLAHPRCNDPDRCLKFLDSVFETSALLAELVADQDHPQCRAHKQLVKLAHLRKGLKNCHITLSGAKPIRQHRQRKFWRVPVGGEINDCGWYSRCDENVFL